MGRALSRDFRFRVLKASDEGMSVRQAAARHPAVLYTWGSALAHRPHVHIILTGWQHRAGREALGLVAPGLPPAGARARQAVPHPAGRTA